MSDKYVIAKKSFLIVYGENNKTYITVNQGQKWKVIGEPHSGFPWYALHRNNVNMQVHRDDYIGKFREVQNEIRDRD